MRDLHEKKKQMQEQQPLGRLNAILNHLKPGITSNSEIKGRASFLDGSLSDSKCSGTNNGLKSSEELNLGIKIIGIGRYLPPHVVSSETLDVLCGKKKGWTEKTSGVKERRWVVSPSQLLQTRKIKHAKNLDQFLPDSNNHQQDYHHQITNSYMGARAAEEAIKDAGLTVNDIDYIINASGTPQHCIPDNSVFIHKQLGISETGIPCTTIHSTCISFLVGLQTAASLVHSGVYKKILIVSSDISSVGLNFDGNPHSATLLGDAAAAVVVTRTPDGEASKLKKARFEAYSEGAHYTMIAGGGSMYHPNHHVTTPEHNLFEMKGSEVLQMTAEKAFQFLAKFHSPLLRGDKQNMACVISHQASYAGLFLLAQLLKWKDEYIIKTLPKFGNCISASIPLTLYEAIKVEKKVKRGQDILFLGTGAGLLLGGVILTY